MLMVEAQPHGLSVPCQVAPCSRAAPLGLPRLSCASKLRHQSKSRHFLASAKKKKKGGESFSAIPLDIGRRRDFGYRLICFHGSASPLYKPSGSIFSNPSKSHMALVRYNGEKSYYYGLLFFFDILLLLTKSIAFLSRVTMSTMRTFSCYDCAVLLSERLSPTLTCWAPKYRKGLRPSLASWNPL